MSSRSSWVKVTFLVADQLLDLLCEFARLTNQPQDQVHELVWGALVAGRAHRGTLVFGTLHGANRSGVRSSSDPDVTPR